MIAALSMELWIAILLFLSFFLLLFLFLIIKKMNRLQSVIYELESKNNLTGQGNPKADPTNEYALKITELLQPLVEDAQKAAVTFDAQIKEKKRLIRELNEALDSRIISINLLLSRADAQQKKLEDRQAQIRHQERQDQERQDQKRFSSASVQTSPASHAVDDQQQILDLYYRKIDIAAIARKLSIPEGEVRLVIDLKEKFLAMEGDSP